MGLLAASSRVLQVAPPSVESSTLDPAPATSSPPDAQTESATCGLTTDQPAPPSAVRTSAPRTGAPTLWARSAMPHPSSALVKSTLVSTSPSGSPAGDQVAPPSAVRSSESEATAHPCRSSANTSERMSARPLYCCVQLAPPSVVAMIAPLPAAQPRLRARERHRVEAVDARLRAGGLHDRRRRAAVLDLQSRGRPAARREESAGDGDHRRPRALTPAAARSSRPRLPRDRWTGRGRRPARGTGRPRWRGPARSRHRGPDRRW